jgi:signal transduction histidine kinase
MPIIVRCAILIVASLLTIFMGVLVFSRKDSFSRRFLFLLETVMCATWAIGIAVFIISNNIEILQTAARVFYIAAAGIAWVWIPLAYALSPTAIKRKVWLVAVLSFIPYAAVAGVVLFCPEVMLHSFQLDPNTVELAGFYNIYAGYFIVYSCMASLILFIRYIHSHTLASKRKNRYLLIVYMIALVVGCVFNLILPWIGNYQLIYIGPVNMAIFALAIYFASASHRMFDIGAVVGKLFGFVISTGILVMAYMITVNIIHITLGLEVSYVIVDAIIVAVLAVPFYLFIQLIDRSTEKIFSKTLLDNKLFDDISRLAIDNIDIQKMLDRITHTIVRNSKLGYALIRMNVANKDLISRSHGSDIPSDDLNKVYLALKKRKTGVLVTEEVSSNEEVYGVLISNNISIVSILRDNETHHIIGMLVIGQEKPTLYSDKEITALSAICDVIVIAVRNSELSMLDKTKDEFMSIASHQLRTPLTSIQGYTSMILDGDFGKMNKEQSHALGEVIASSHRMAVLIDDLLNVSRLQSGKFILSRVPTNMADLTRSEIDQANMMASSHGVKLVFDDTKWDALPELTVDRAKVGEVMANLIDNAVFYSRQGSTVEILLTQNAGDLEFRVKDHGIGVPKKDQADLFTKFFRASNARTVRPDGTGIGLFLAKKVISEHNGEIIFSSIEGKGSVFGFSLPIK